MNMQISNKVWITWETQRRSIELAKKLDCELYIFDYSGLSRYPLCITKTIKTLLSKRPDMVFVQNPSMILTATVCLYGKMSKTKVIVDRHTTFMLNRRVNIGDLIFKILHKYTIKKADLTILSNDFLARIVEKMGGSAHVLPDRLPQMQPNGKFEVKTGFNILLVSSFGNDEPIEEVINAMRSISGDDINLYISGNCNKLNKSLKNNLPFNVVLTDYLEEESFINLMHTVDAVMVLTTADYCMLCGCYEGVSLNKPIITSKKSVLQEYFEGSVFVENVSEDIVRGIIEMKRNYLYYKNNVVILKKRLEDRWESQFKELKSKIQKCQ